MKLQTVILINRAPFQDLELNFGDENVIVLSGINGAGKTTILSYIVDAFYELAKKGFNLEFEDKSNKFYRISSSLFSLDDTKVSIVYLRFKNDGQIADYIDIRGKCSQTEYDDVLKIPDKIPYSSFKTTLEQDKSVKFWQMSKPDNIKEVFNNNLLTYFPAYRYEEPSFLNEPYNFKLSFAKEMTFIGYLKNPIEVTSDLPQIANWIMDVVLDQSVYHDEALFLFAQLNELIDRILITKVSCHTRFGIGRRYTGASRIAIMNRDVKNDQIYPSIFSMSSGELALLCLFGELIKQADKINKLINAITGVVLVDEIDKHLHIRLQKEILPALITMYPKLQFIVTSHAPFLGLGLAETPNLAYTIYDLDNNGHPCPPQDNELFKEVYLEMIKQNERYYLQYKYLREKLQNDTKPLIITEGKTDWKHLKAAMKALNVKDLNIELYEYDEPLGDSALLQLLKDIAKIRQTRIIIGVFDRDNIPNLSLKDIGAKEFVKIQNNVYGFAIPLVNEEVYHTQEISIEHYYDKDDLTKETAEGKRIFLGEEFYLKGVSKDTNYLTRCKGIDKKSRVNGVVDNKVFNIKKDPGEECQVALSKDEFANLVLNGEEFAKGFDFSKFNVIFDVIRKIVSEN